MLVTTLYAELILMAEDGGESFPEVRLFESRDNL